MIEQLPTLNPRIAFAFSAGIGTFLAPCAFPMLPGYVAYFLGNGSDERLSVGRRLLKSAGVASVVSGGFVAAVAPIAAVAIVFGSGPLQNIKVLELAVGLLLIGLGIAMVLDRFQPSALHVRLPERRSSLLGYFLFGVVYGVAAAGCTGPILVAVVSSTVGQGPATTAGIFGAYVMGMSVMMLGVTALSGLGREAMVRRISGVSGRLTRVAGIVLILAGVAQIYLFLFRYDGLQTLGLA